MTTERHESTADLLDALRRVIRTSRAVSQRQQSAYGFSGTPFGILKALGIAAARPGDLAISLQIAPSVVSRAIAALEQAGLVQRHTDPDDARAFQVGLTPAGRQHLDDAHRRLVAQFAELLESWPSADIDVLAQLLLRLENTISNQLPLTEQPPIGAKALA
jgi:DNA-binding MarR family transcriptional regulator